MWPPSKAACSAVCSHDWWHRSPQRPRAMSVGTSLCDTNHNLTPIFAPFILVSYLPIQRPLLPSPGCRVAPKEPLKGNFPSFLQEPEQTVSTGSSTASPALLPQRPSHCKLTLPLSQGPHNHRFCSLLGFLLICLVVIWVYSPVTPYPESF